MCASVHEYAMEEELYNPWQISPKFSIKYFIAKARGLSPRACGQTVV